MARLGGLLRALFGWHHGLDAEVVGTANVAAAVAVGIAVHVKLDASLIMSALSAFGVFSGLTAFLLNHHTFWISVVVGGLALAAVPALLLGALGTVLLGVFGGWLGVALGLAFGLGIAFSAYSGLVRTARRG